MGHLATDSLEFINVLRHVCGIYVSQVFDQLAEGSLTLLGEALIPFEQVFGSFSTVEVGSFGHVSRCRVFLTERE